MRIDFQKAFAVDIRHEYYPDEISGDFRIAPTPHCQQQLQNFGMLFKETPGGFVVLCETFGDGTPPTPKRTIASPLTLTFALWSHSPFLANFSNLPLDKTPEQFFALSNRQKNFISGQRLLTADPIDEFLSVADLFSLRPQRFQVDVETPQDSVLWELLDVQGGLVKRQRVNTVEGVSSFLVKLSTQSPGRYLLRRDAVEHLHFYADDRLLGNYPFGLIEIALDPLVSNDFRFIDGSGKLQFRRYRLKLQARRTTWEYFVVAKYETGVKPEDLTLTLDNPPVTFTRQPAVTLADGKTAIPFVAGTTLPLSQQPLKGIALSKKKGPSTPKLDIENLPNPAVSDLIPAGGGKVISRVYVYV